jgi:hypothetical protein
MSLEVLIQPCTPRHRLPCIKEHKYKIFSSSMENCSSGNGIAPCWCRNILSLAHAGILHSSMPEDVSGM